MCLAMLVGTTFAWFTDSEEATRNVIQTGTLDVELYYSTDKGASWHSIEGTSNIFGGSFWEPGCTQLVWFKVKNAGTLALKYKMDATVYSEKGGITLHGIPFKLSDHIYSAVVDINATRDDILAITDASPLAEGLLHEDDSFYLEGGKESDPFAIAVWMPTTVGNEANHNGHDIPRLDLGLAIYATQKNIESDSYGPDYDINATYDENVSFDDEQINN